MTRLQVTLVYLRATKNTYRYEEQNTEGEPLAIGTLYVQKFALPAPPPTVLTLTLVPLEEPWHG